MTAGLNFKGGIARCPPPRRSAAVNDRRPRARGARVFERVIDGETGVVPSKGTASPPPLSTSRRFPTARLVTEGLGGYKRNLRILRDIQHLQLLASRRQRNHGRHLDVRRRASESVKLLRVQKHDRALRAGVEGCGVKGTVLALHGHDMPTIKTTDSAAPLSGCSSHRSEA